MAIGKPIIEDWLRGILARISRLLNNSLTKFFTRSEQNIAKTYEDLELIQSIVKKTLEYAQVIQKKNSIPISSIRTILPFALGKFGKRITVLDFGGGAGVSFIEAKHFYPNSDFKWIILETQTMVRIAKQLHVNTKELKFIENLEEIENLQVDLIIANSSLQYTPNPLELLKKITKLKARYLYITRMPLTELSSVSVLQTSMLKDNGPQTNGIDKSRTKVQVPANIVRRIELEAILEIDYDTKHKILEEKNSFHTSRGSFDFFGYFCLLKN
jgi:putative methyltransferase (TIGR04325 family)